MNKFTSRKIKYRAIAASNINRPDIWPHTEVYGTYTERGNQAIISTDPDKPLVTVFPNTISEFTGLYDINEKEFYEHDFFESYNNRVYVVEYFNGAFGYKEGDLFISFAHNIKFNWINNKSNVIKILGNSITHPEKVDFYKKNNEHV